MRRKVFVAIAALAVLLSLLAGCGKTVKCDFCAKEKKCETLNFGDEELHICDDCKDELEGLFG